MQNAEALLLGYIEPQLPASDAGMGSGQPGARQTDLDAELINNPGRLCRCSHLAGSLPCAGDAHRLGPLSTTRPELIKALAAVAELDYAPHLEVETYTWRCFPIPPRQT